MTTLSEDQLVISRGAEPRSRMTSVANVLLIAWFVICSAAIFPLLEMGDSGDLSDDSMARLRWLLVPNLIAVPVLTLLRARAILNVLLRYPALVLLVLWIWLSVLWSVDPALSARRALSFTANTIIACFVVSFFRPKEIVRTLTFAVMGLVGLSLVFAAVLPDLAFMPDSGEFRGVFTHKNVMGALLGIAAMLLAVCGRVGLISPLATAGGLATIVALVIPTGSATAMMLVALVAVLHVPIAIAGMPGRLATVGMAFLILCGLALALPLLFGRNRIFMAIGRDPTLTGRTELWAFVQGMIDQRPLHGYGYQAFFDLRGVHEHVLGLVGWDAPNAHNGYLEVWLGLGLVGLMLTIVFLLRGFMRAVRALIDDPKSVPACFAFFCLGVYLFRNFTESDLLDQSGLSWILAVLAVLMVGHRQLAVRRQVVSAIRGSVGRVWT
jgi:exopolysaccharide production protein ExoQ